jgi:hypothetical protein
MVLAKPRLDSLPLGLDIAALEAFLTSVKGVAHADVEHSQSGYAAPPHD